MTDTDFKLLELDWKWLHFAQRRFFLFTWVRTKKRGNLCGCGGNFYRSPKDHDYLMPKDTRFLCDRNRQRIRHEKRAQTQTFDSRYFRGGVKKFGMSVETTESKLLGGVSRDFAGISLRRPKSLRPKKVCVQFLAPSESRFLIYVSIRGWGKDPSRCQGSVLYWKWEEWRGIRGGGLGYAKATFSKHNLEEGKRPPPPRQESASELY